MPVVPMQLGLTDPSWDLIDPTPDIRALFENFNQIFFYGALGSVEVKWSNRMTSCAGVCSYEGNGGLCSVRLSAPLLKLRPRRDLVETLLHEMIHAYMFVTSYIRDRDGHGEEFQRHMNRINAAAGTKISIYHDFQPEVQLYKVHVWRCNGPCRFSHPFYGTVRRSMNRAPGPNDRWFASHARKCSGRFTKELGGPPKIERKKPKNNDRDIRRLMLTYKPVSSEENDDPAKYPTIPPFNGLGHKLGGRTRVTSDNSATVARPSATVTRPSSTITRPSTTSADPLLDGTTVQKPRCEPANSGNLAIVASPTATSTSPGQKSRRRQPANSGDVTTVGSPSATSTSNSDETWQELGRSHAIAGNLANITSPPATSTSPIIGGSWQERERLTPVNFSNLGPGTSSSVSSTIPTFGGTEWRSGGTTIVRPSATITRRPLATITQPLGSMTSMTLTEAHDTISRPSAIMSIMSATEAYNAIAGPSTNLFSMTATEAYNAITRPSAIVTNMTATEAYNAYADSITSAISVPMQQLDSSSTLQGVSVFKATSVTLDTSSGTAASNDTFASQISSQKYEKSLTRSVSDNTGRRLGSKYPEASKATHEMSSIVHGQMDKYGRINGISVDRVTDARFIPQEDLAVVPIFDLSARPSEIPLIPQDGSTSSGDWPAITDHRFIPFADAPAGTSSGYQGDRASISSQQMPIRISSKLYPVPEQNAILNVECPICLQSVTIGSINYHIDSNCTKGMAPKVMAPRIILRDICSANENGKDNVSTGSSDGLDDVSTFERGEDGTYRKCFRDVNGMSGTNDYVSTNKRSINGDGAIDKRSRYDSNTSRVVDGDLYTHNRDGGMSSKSCYICNRKFNNMEILIAHEQNCMSALFPDQVVQTEIGIATVPDVDTGPQMTVCPNCGAPIPFSTINAHLDYCLA